VKQHEMRKGKWNFDMRKVQRRRKKPASERLRHIKCQVYSRAARKFTSSSALVSGSRSLNGSRFTESIKSKACNQSKRDKSNNLMLTNYSTLCDDCAESRDAHAAEIETVTRTCSKKGECAKLKKLKRCGLCGFINNSRCVSLAEGGRSFNYRFDKCFL
jgi:hypothetical protein